MAGTSSLKAGGAYVSITLDDTRLVQGLKAAQRKLRDFGASVSAFGKQMTMIGSAVFIPLGMALKQFADFDDQMRLVQGVTGASAEDFRRLTERAKELGRTTSYTARQVAEGMVALSRMGFTAKETHKAIEDFMNLDIATGMGNLGATAEIAGNAMRSFGMNTGETGRIADVLTATANMSAQTLTDVGEALKMGAANAHMANATLEDTCSMLGVLANLGIRGSLAGTAIAKSFERLASGSGVDVLKRWGIDSKGKGGNLRPMRDILVDIAKVTKTLGSADKIAFLTDVFDVRGAKGGGLISGNMKALDEMMDKIASSEGMASQTAKNMDSGMGGTLRRLQSGLEGVSLTLGEIISEYIKPFAENISGVLNVLAKWLMQNKQFVTGAVKFTGALVAAGSASIVLGVALKALAFTPVAWLVTLGAGVYGVYKAVELCTGSTAKFDGLLRSVIATASNARAVFGDTFKAALEALSTGNFEGAKKVFKAGLSLVWLEGIAPLRGIWADLLLDMQNTWTLTGAWLQEKTAVCWHGLVVGLGRAGGMMAEAWRSIWNGVLNTFDWAMLSMRKSWLNFKSLFDGGNSSIEISRLNNGYAQRMADRARASEQAKTAWNRGVAGLAGDRTGALQRIEEERDKAIAEQFRRSETDRSETLREIEAARHDWLKAIEEIKAKSAAGTLDGASRAGRKLQQQLAGVNTGATAGLNAKTSATGAFSGGALNAILGRDTAMSRTARATERMANVQDRAIKYQERTAKGIENLQGGGLVYA